MGHVILVFWVLLVFVGFHSSNGTSSNLEADKDKRGGSNPIRGEKKRSQRGLVSRRYQKKSKHPLWRWRFPSLKTWCCLAQKVYALICMHVKMSHAILRFCFVLMFVFVYKPNNPQT